MSTETTQDNFAGMTAEQKIKALVLMRWRAWGYDVPALTKDTINGMWEELRKVDDLRDARNEVRCSGSNTGLPCREVSRNYESEEVAAQMPDGSWVGWTFWHGGGKHGEPDAIHWIPFAYDVTCAEEQKMVTVRTFAKVGA